MAYNKKGYYVRARVIKSIADEYYEKENQAKCHKRVWRKYVYPRFGICYRSYLKYCKVTIPEEMKEAKEGKQLSLW